MAEVSTRQVAVVGLGVMGGRIARRLLSAGHEVTVWNRDGRKAAPLVADGCRAVRTPADAARATDVVITMVSDAEALRAVTAGADGVLAGLSDGGTLVQMSTVGVESMQDLQASLPEQVALLDAPVLGSVVEAESGTLTVFAGGPDSLLRDVRPLLSALGTVLPVGPVGMGTAAKLVANASLLGVVGLLGEVLSLADGLGLPTRVAHDVLAATPLAAQADRRRPVLESRQFPPRFALSLARKDADLIIRPDLDLRLLPAVRSWLVDAEAAGSGEEDYAAVLATIIDAPRRR